MTAFYNEIDPGAVAVLRHLIDAGVIAPGIVDTRSIKDIQPDDLDGFDQCHFFAGGGLWSVAARLAGWDDARPLWTGSCPCQPFSAAGKRAGADDPRHLWPDFHRLIRARRPAVVVGEQVAGAAGYGWLDGVRADMASENYASRGVDIPACAVDAPHQRNRLYWIAVADALGGERDGRSIEQERGPEGRDASFGADARGRRGGMDNAIGDGQRGAREQICAGRQPADDADAPSRGERVAFTDSGRHEGRSVFGPGEGDSADQQRAHGELGGPDGRSGVMGDAFQPRLEGHAGDGDEGRGSEQDRPIATARRGEEGAGAWDGELERLSRRNGSYWAGAEWIICHDGKARRTKPGLRLLVDGLPGRVDLWRVGGNAIVPAEAAEVLRAYLDIEMN